MPNVTNTTAFVARDVNSALAHLIEHGYVVLEGVLGRRELGELRLEVESIFDQERQVPYDPPDGPLSPDDAAIEAYLAAGYTVGRDELARLMRRIRHAREQNLGTPWPVPPQEVNKTFLHLPTLFDQDRSQRVWNLLAKGDVFAKLVEHQVLLEPVRRVLGADCVLSDVSATSIGPHTDGGAWHVDVPLGQLPEPLPDFPLTLQNVWMLDDFTPENGATRVVPASHLSRRKPAWASGPMPDEVSLAAPAGSVAIWLSNTWHRSGPNVTDHARRAILCYYCRSWIKPFTDFRAGVKPETAARFSPTVRYLMGFSASSLVRG